MICGFGGFDELVLEWMFDGSIELGFVYARTSALAFKVVNVGTNLALIYFNYSGECAFRIRNSDGDI